MKKRYYSVEKLLQLLIFWGISFLFTACTSTHNKNNHFSIQNYQEIPYAQLADFNVALETSGEAESSSSVKVAIFHQRETNTSSQQHKRLLVTSMNDVVSLENSVLLPSARFVRPNIAIVYRTKQLIMRVSLLISDYDITPNSTLPPMRLIDYEYEFTNAYWQLSKYTDTTHRANQQGAKTVYINSEERIDLKKNERTVKVGNRLTKTTFLHTQNILLADSLGYRVVIDTSKKGINVLLEKIDFQR